MSRHRRRHRLRLLSARPDSATGRRRSVDEELDRRLVAVMFTDLVGYTALFQADERVALDKRNRYTTAVERGHDAFGGTIVQRLGDGTMSMFPSSLAAVQAAVEIQRELAKHDVPMRVGIHVGEVIVEPHGLIGDPVNIAARIESFAVPGGVMLSDAAFDLIRNRPDIGAVGLGRFKLKNVGRPFELYAIAAAGIVVPDPRDLEGKGERFASLPSNLPDPVTPVIGRAADLESIVALVRDRRVVTITGPGGIGKTRILVEVGRALAPEFLDGVAFIPLAGVAAPEGFVPALAAALDVKEAEGRTLGDGVVALIGDRKALLLLDNLEQIVRAAREVAGLVTACPNLRIVTSSRTPLRITAEQEYPLAALALPASTDSETVESLLDYPAIALFVERARTTRGSFALTPENADAIAAVCRRLDGLPLAIELAAARLRVLSPEALLDRLDHALNVLTSGSRDVPERQQTLRAAIDWSHDLLSASEQRTFRRLAVFVGGCTIADVEAVCADPGDSSLDDLESLIDNALVQVDGQGNRLRMLQTIGEYARERLEAAGERGDVALRHARRFADLARSIRDGIEGTEQAGSLERGIADEGNLVAALDTFLAAAREGDAAASEAGLQLCGDLWLYWHIRGKNLTAREYATSFLGGVEGGPPTAGRAGALVTAGLASDVLGQFDRANDEWAEAYRIASRLGADRELCIGAFLAGFGQFRFDLPAGIRLMEEGIERSRAAGFTWAEGFASSLVGILHAVAGDLETARARFEHGLRIQEVIGDQEGAALSLGGLAGQAVGRGDLASALDLYGRSLAAYEAVGDRAEEARILGEMAWVHLRDGNASDARRRFLDSIQAYTDVASLRGVGVSLTGLAAAASVEGDHERAVQIAAAAEVFAREEGIVNVYSEQTPGQEFVERARASLPAARVAQATEFGSRLTIKHALDLARTADLPPA
ncbi:MAG: adenylate/guanylate cyclase domain-containing protein [Chloroflexota bacterium]|nr:MAG: adenylate/guanylate cyclase domain-containing protein [Chloroflexota bacterium]